MFGGCQFFNKWQIWIGFSLNLDLGRILQHLHWPFADMKYMSPKKKRAKLPKNGYAIYVCLLVLVVLGFDSGCACRIYKFRGKN